MLGCQRVLTEVPRGEEIGLACEIIRRPPRRPSHTSRLSIWLSRSGPCQSRSPTATDVDVDIEHSSYDAERVNRFWQALVQMDRCSMELSSAAPPAPTPALLTSTSIRPNRAIT